MRYVAAYLLCVMGGNSDPSAADISKVLTSVGIDVDDKRVELIINELKGKNVEELMAAGKSKLASVPAGGVSAGPATGGGAEKAEEAPKEEKKEEKKPESEEESDDDMGFGLFD